MTGMLDVLDRCRKSSGVRRNCKGGGRFTNRCDDAVALCCCGVSPCAMLAAREVPKMNTIERFVVAGFVAPRLRSGTFPRVIGVVDANGVVVRKITGEDLGRELLKRAEIECSSPVPPTVCHKCGGRKLPESKVCGACTFSKGLTKVCACGGKKSWEAKACHACTYDASRHICPGCGVKKSKGAKACAACAGYAKKNFGCPMCSGPKATGSVYCRACARTVKKNYRGRPVHECETDGCTMSTPNARCGVCMAKRRNAAAVARRAADRDERPPCVTCLSNRCRGKCSHRPCACGRRIAAPAAMCADCIVQSRGAVDVGKAAKLYLCGASMVDAGAAVGVSKTTLAKLFRANNVPIRASGWPNGKRVAAP